MSRLNESLTTVLLAVLIAAGSFGCATSQSGQEAPADSSDTPELTKELIDRRINDARIYDVPPESGTGEPIAWGFDEDEPKEITVVDQQINGKHATVILDIKTRTNPHRRGPVRRLAGQIRTEWELRTGWALRRWEIINTENISMKYNDDPPPSPPVAPSPAR